MERESLQYDVIIVGGGPAGLSAAIRYAQLCNKANKPLSLCVVEKGAQIGAHSISGAVLDPRALDRLIPDWRAQQAPIETQVSRDHFYWLTAKQYYPLPVPAPMRNAGHFIISVGALCRWLADIAQSMGVEIYPGFAAASVLSDSQGKVVGVSIGDKGRDKTGGIDITARHTVLAEGCRGSLSQSVIARYALNKTAQPQTYGLGVKEIWEVKSGHCPGKVSHTIGWPLDRSTYGGSFIYHWGKNLVSIGLVIGLDYKNPFLDPFKELQRFKHHPLVLPLLEGGRCIAYGARAVNEGGWQSLPQLTFPGGLLIGDSAGFLDVPKIKGIHNAMLSGMLASEAIFEEDAALYPLKIAKSWIKKELYRVRNIRPAFRWGLWTGLAYAALDTYILRGYAPWTFSHRADNTSLQLAKQCMPIAYPKPDGKISFDKMTSVSLTNVHHSEGEPCHLVLKDPSLAISVNWEQYRGPEQYYCPAGVYEYIDEASGKKRLQINASNCIHCKTCDIKDPLQNIVWHTPEGGGGPFYENM
jgi:electron-transferring-flavoprotein dehydrogenase